MVGEPISPCMLSICSVDQPVVQYVGSALDRAALRKQLARHHGNENVGEEKVCLHVLPTLSHLEVDARRSGGILPAW
ncbi:hypothetical protein D9M68_919470 [compost metagenome]